jgi:hypothetical protein
LFEAAIPELKARVVPLAIDKAPLPRPVLLPRDNVPADSVVPPEKVLLPLILRVPAPALVKPAPTPEITPLKVPVPVATFIVPEVLRPTLFDATMPEFKERVVPLAIDKAPLPNPVSLPRDNVPADNVVPPEKVLLPLTLRVPEPVLVKTASTPEITPLKVPVPAPTLIVPAVLRLTLFDTATPELKEKVVPLAITRAPLPNPVLLARDTVPADNVVPPENVLLPLRLRVPAPPLVKAAPEITPPKVPVPAPTLTVPPVLRLTLFDAATPEPKERVVPLAIARAPLPSPVLLPRERTPADNVVPPEKVLSPLRLRVPAPVFVNKEPEPEMAPLRDPVPLLT